MAWDDALGLEDFRPWTPPKWESAARAARPAAPAALRAPSDGASLQRLVQECCMSLGKESEAARFYGRLKVGVKSRCSICLLDFEHPSP